MTIPPSKRSLLAENAALRALLEEAQEALREIRSSRIKGSADPQAATAHGSDTESKILHVKGNGETIHAEASMPLPCAGEGPRQIAIGNRLEAPLRASEERLLLALEASRSIAWSWDLRSGTVLMSENVVRSMGIPAQLDAATAVKVIHPEDAAHLAAAAERAIAERGSYSAEIRVIRPTDGAILWGRICGKVQCNKAGEPVLVIGTATDITEAKQGEQALRESEARFRSLFENSLDAMFLTVPDGTVTAANPAACAMFGMSEGELCRAGREGITNHADPRHAEAIAKRSLIGRLSVELTYVRKNGAIFPAEVQSAIVGGVKKQAFVVMRDITERKRAEKLLHESEQLHRVAFDLAPTGMVYAGPDGRLLRVNQSMCAITGYSAEELTQMKTLDLTHPEDLMRDAVPLAAFLSGGAPKYDSEKRYLCKGGGICWVSVSARMVTDAEGRPLHSVGVILDITDRVVAQAQLRESEERFRSVFHNASTPMVVSCRDGHFLEVNRAYCEMLGYSEPELLATTFIDLTHPEDRHTTAIDAARRLVAREITTFRCEKRYLHKGGQIVWCDVGISAVSHAEGSVAYFIAQAHDITARKMAEAALIRSEQFARSQWAEAEAAIEAVPAHIAILDANGVIVRVNKEWATFASQNGAVLGSVAVGIDYLGVCDSVTEVEAAQASSFAAGIRSVISGACERFSMEYPCHSPEQQRWFMGYVTACRGEGLPCAVIAHVEITTQKLIEEQIRLLNHGLETRVVERTSELQAAVGAIEAQIAERQRLEREILEVSEREQCRLGQDLHDGLSQELAGIALLGKVLAKALESSPSAKLAADLAAYAANSIESARRIAKGLYPVELSRNGLYLALEDLARQTNERFGVCCEVRQNGEMPMLKQSAKIHIYRIIQECIGNAIKHGKASRIIIEWLASDGIHTFTVTDNGLGFGPPAASSGMGLSIMNYRARVFGAQIDIRKPSEGGCRITCQWRMASEE